MHPPCLPCASGPKGSAGHDGLNVHKIGDGRLMLRCRACQSSWCRTLAKNGSFAWAMLTKRRAASAEMGIPVPPLSLASERRGLPWRGENFARTARGA